MLHTTRRLLAPLLVAAAGAGLVIAPQAASAAGITGTVSVAGTLKVRSAASLSAAIVGTVRNNQRITVQCVVVGTTVRGTVRTTNFWDRLATGKYISHAYVRVPSAIPRCAVATPQAAKTAPALAYKIGTIRSTDGSVNLRSAPSTTGRVTGTLPANSLVRLACMVAGEFVAGTVRSTNQWDRTTGGVFLSHGYIDSPALPLCPGYTTQPTTGVAMTSAQFIAAAVPGAQLGWRQYGVPPSVTIAQAILESGWGRSGLASVDRNYFGIKCFNGVYGALANGCHLYKTNECTKAGKCFATQATFRTYASMAHSFRDHGNFLKVNSRYAGAFTYTKDANKFIWAVWKAGYATDPNYYTKVTGIMAANGLYRYDTWK
jgi:hypothetical protein